MQDLLLTQHRLYQYQLEVDDPDIGDVLTYSLLQNPVWLSIGSTTGETVEDQMDFRTTVIYDSDDSEEALAEETEEEDENGISWWQDGSGKQAEGEDRRDIDKLSDEKLSLKLDLETGEITIPNVDIFISNR